MIDGARRVRPWAGTVAALMVAVVLAGCRGPEEPEHDPTPGLPRGILTITGNGPAVQVRVEIAETPEAKLRGLMGRRSLAPDAGMVFLEEDPATTGFWMKDTLIPLSIGFWGQDGRIFQILDMEPCRQETCPLYEPRDAWVGALEVNQGFFDRRGIQEGDLVELRRLSPG